MATGQGRVHEGARAEESDSARRVVQLIVTDGLASGFQERRRCGDLDGGG